MRYLALNAIFLALFTTMPTAAADRAAELLGVAERTRKLIDEAADAVNRKQYLDAVTRLQQVIDKSGDDLVRVDDTRLYRPARWVAHRLIAGLPAEGLRLYRSRAEPGGRVLFERGRERLDAGLLRQVVEQAFCTRAGEDALLLLGEIAFREGEFEAARHYWGSLLPDGGGLAHPDPVTEPAQLRARLIVCRIFAGRTEEAVSELAEFRQRHGDAEGHLAGRDGNYAEILSSLKTPDFGPPDTWGTFAGGGGRNAVPTGRLPYYWPDRPTWSVAIPPAVLDRSDPPLAEGDPRALAFHPVTDGDLVWVADAGRILGYDALRGDLRSVFAPFRPNQRHDLRPPVGRPLRHTLHLRDRFLIARLGETAARPGEVTVPARLVCLEQSPASQRPCWRLMPEAETIWEGVPALSGRRMLTLQSRFEGGKRVERAVAYLLPDDPRAAPRPDWSRDLVRTTFDPNAPARHRHSLLTLAGSLAIDCTHAGWIIALDGATGRPAWAYRYPLAGRPMSPLREPGPCVYADGKLFAAPADAESVFCLDPHTGKPIWEHPMAVGSLFGIAEGVLVGTTVGDTAGVFGMDAASGDLLWFRHDGGGGDLRPHGRGLLTPEVVLWPTNHGLHFLDTKTGEPLRLPLPGAMGNIAFADGVLVVATATELLGFVAERRWLPERAEEVGRYPDDAEARYRLALSQADAGDIDDAVANFLRAGARDRAAELLRDQPLRLTAPEWPPPQRSDAFARLAIREREAGRTVAARAWADRLRSDPESRAVFLNAGDGISIQAGRWADRFLGQTEKVRPRPLSATVPPTGPLSAPIRHGWRVARGGVFLTFDGPVSACFIADADQATAISLPDGEVRWQRGLPFAASRGWAVGEDAVLAGPGGVCRIDCRDGKLRWVWRPSVLDPLASRGSLRSLEPEYRDRSLAGFRLDGGRILALSGRGMIAIDAEDGRQLWSADALGSSDLLTPAGPSFTENFAAAGGYVLAQRSDGGIRQIDARTGMVTRLRADDVTTVTWPTPPAVLPDGSFVFAEEPGRVSRVRFPGPVRVWSHQIGRHSGLSGRPPGVRASGDTVVCQVRRNHADEIVALARDTGEVRWVVPSPGRLPDLADAGGSGDSLFLAFGDRLKALDQGRPVWEVPIVGARGDERWRVSLSGETVIVKSRTAIPKAGWSAYRGTVGRAGRDLASDPGFVPWRRLAMALNGAESGWYFPVLLFDRYDGRLIQRFEFPASDARGDFRRAGGSAVVVTGLGAWRFGGE